MYEIKYGGEFLNNLKELSTSKRREVLDRIGEQLIHQPTQETRNKKILKGLNPPWDYDDPIWELRIGESRVFYDVDDAAKWVTVRALRQKPPHKTTEEIL
jgi:mRNA-degrading endonuclease RelE of RelBE toxin-antitoxin system